jgi:hypothetical protein
MYKTGMGGAHFLVRQNCECDLNYAYHFGRRQGISVRTNGTQTKMSSAALFRILFWPRLGPLGWTFFDTRRAAGAKNRLPQKQPAVKTDEEERSNCLQEGAAF